MTSPPPDQLYPEPTFVYGDSPHSMNADPEKAIHLSGEGRSVLHSNLLPHHPAPVAEEVHRQGQSWTRCPRQEITDRGIMPKAPTYECRGAKLGY